MLCYDRHLPFLSFASNGSQIFHTPDEEDGDEDEDEDEDEEEKKEEEEDGKEME
jgi:hypothetical protein